MYVDYLLEFVNHLSEVRCHEQSLKQTVHVAGGPLIAESFELLLLFFLL